MSLDSETGRHCTFTTDEPGWDYFIMHVTELPHILDKDVTDDLGMVFAKGSAVVAGNYYERYRLTSRIRAGGARRKGSISWTPG